MATSSKPGLPLAALAIASAIVGALISEPGILAHTPDGSHQGSASAIAMPGLGLYPDRLSLTDGLQMVLPRSSPESQTATDVAASYPPYGRTLPIDFVPDAQLPALVAGARPDQSAPAVTSAAVNTAPARPAPKPRIVTWHLAPTVTWYGPGFYGGRTACGQHYTRQTVGVAGRTLPCGTLVQFRWHGITVVAPVIDRGPFGSSGLVFDLSARLACDLFRERGHRNGCYTRHDMQWRVVGRRRN